MSLFFDIIFTYLQQLVKTKLKVTRTFLDKCNSGSLTGGLVPVSAYSNVILLVALLGSRYLLHLSDFRHAQFGVIVEECTTTLNGQVVLGPIPQLTQVLVVQRIEGVVTKRDRGKKREKLNTM